MKKSLLALAALGLFSWSADAQTRMTIHEEFTGENCPPCASTNPTFWSLVNGASNPSKLIHIAYMEPIPSSGWYYLRTKALSDTRASYYSVPFAPYGRYDGHVPNPTASSPGHPGYFTQSDIDAEYAIPDSFTLSVSNAWNATYDSVITTVTVTCVAPWIGSGATPNVKLRAALVQTNDFATSPGTNGETHFENVVQAMYPDAGGTTLPGTWTTGMTQTYTITGAVPSWIDKSGSPYMVVWMQDDNSKTIPQAGKGSVLPAIANDGAITAVTAPGFTCAANGTFTVTPHTVTIKNTGSSTLTSADIYYQIDGGSWTSTPWTGSIAPGSTSVFTMPVSTVTVSGALYHSVIDSIASPNGSVDQNPINNAKGKSFFIESTNALAMPYTTSYETVDLGKFYYTDNNNNGETWSVYTNSSGLGHTGSNAASFQCYDFAAGEVEYITLPLVTTTANSALSFWVAYCQYDATTDDQLEVVYSTDCGSNWTSIWSASGSSLSTTAISTSPFTPTASKYVQKSVSLSAVPAGAMLGFRGTSAYGNNIWVDDINMHSTLGVKVANAEVTATIYPNPAKETATLTLNLNAQTDVTVQISDATGRVLAVPANEKMNAGIQAITINTAALASGVYNVVIHTDGGTTTQRLTVIK